MAEGYELMGDTVVAFVDDRIDSILCRPKMWGSVEACEMQILQLLEVRLIAKTKEPMTMLFYKNWLRQTFPKQPSTLPLFSILKRTKRQTEFQALMRSFVASQQS